MSRKTVVHTFSTAGGLNNYDAPNRISDSQVMDSVNNFPGYKGILSSRYPFDITGTEVYTDVFLTETENRILVKENGEVYFDFALIDTLLSNGADNAPAIHCEFGGSVYYSSRYADGSTSGKYHLKKYHIESGIVSLVAEFSNKIMVMKVFSNRLMLTFWDYDLGRIYMSPYNTDANFDEDISVTEQRQITDIQPVNNSLVISTEKDIYRMTGKSLLSFRTDVVIPNFGCKPYSMQVWNNILFMSSIRDGRMYMWDSYGIPRAIDENVFTQDYVDDMKPTYNLTIKTSNKGYTIHNDLLFYRGSVNSTKLYVFNLLKFQKDGNPSGTYWDFAVDVMHKRLFTGDFVLGNKFMFMIDDQKYGRDTVAGGGLPPGPRSIVSRIKSKMYDFGVMQNDKRVLRAFINYTGSFDAIIKLYFEGERSAVSEVTKSFAGALGIPSTQLIVFPSGNNFGKFISFEIETTGSSGSTIDSFGLEIDTEAF